MIRTTDRARLQGIAAATDKALGLPRKGQRRGGGIHVDIPDEYYEGAPGWTARWSEIRPVLDEADQPTGEWAYDLDDDTAARVEASGRVTAAEKQLVRDARRDLAVAPTPRVERER